MDLLDIQIGNAVFKKLIETPEDQRAAYLIETFADNPDFFCQFLGSVHRKLSTIKMRRDKAMNIMNDIALAAVSIGRRDGFDDAIRRYAPDYKFLLENKKTEVVA